MLFIIMSSTLMPLQLKKTIWNHPFSSPKHTEKGKFISVSRYCCGLYL